MTENPKLELVDEYEIDGLVKPFKGTVLEAEVRAWATAYFLRETGWQNFDDEYEEYRDKLRDLTTT